MTQQTPSIVLWSGNRQSFGRSGRSQRWVNVLGRITGALPIRLLEYSLNDGPPTPLSVGPDGRRLAARGDFNIDLDRRTLVAANRLRIRAVDAHGQEATAAVELLVEAQHCPLPYYIDWARAGRIEDVVQIVDGQWAIHTDGVNSGISPLEIGYDRLVAIGDLSWRDYEVEVPITVHGINASCYNDPSVHAGVGVVMRWKGHYNWGEDAWASGQPYHGPVPYGAIGWYCIFHDVGPMLNFFDPDFRRMAEKPYLLVLHAPYILRVRVETLPDGISLYSLKAWRAEAEEPAEWDMVAPGSEAGLSEGAVLLGAHHMAATFGNVVVRPL